jgi:hypothetical protein
MKRAALHAMTIEELVERFTAIALAQYEALEKDEFAKYNRLYGEMEAVRQELKIRPGDQRRALQPLLDQPNAQVRLKAAISLLSIAPDAARQTLQLISDRNEFPQAAYALGTIRALENGTFVPS